MNSSLSRREFAAAGIAAGLPLTIPVEVSAAPKPNAVIRIIVGPSKHPPGTHEVPATGRLLKHLIERAVVSLNRSDIAVEIHDAWPAHSQDLDNTSSFVFVGDFFPPSRMNEKDRIMADLENLMSKGCGLVCVHYATGLGSGDVAEDGSHPLLNWMGGYFATRCKHHQSVARIFEQATIVPSPTSHPILHGWNKFTFHDEPYIRNYFGPNGPASNVTILATADLPPESPKPEPVAWAVERADSGRGVGVVMPHFFRNWLQADMRKLILNAVVWSAKLDVPAKGIDVALDNLVVFDPVSVEPIEKKKS